MGLRIKTSFAMALVFALVMASRASFAAASTRARADVAVVHSLYDAFATEAVLEDPATDKLLLDQPRGVLLRYFTPELSALILRDRACALRTREICALDFSPIWDSQDPTGATVRLASEPALGSVRAVVRYPDGEQKELVFRLAKTGAGWRIADILYAGDRRTLTQILEREDGGS